MQEHNLSENNFEECLKCTICNSVCPMMAVNPSYPGPKQAGPDGERYRIKDPRYYDLALQYCLNCKRCEVACPSGVKVGDIIRIARLKYGRQAHPFRDRILADTEAVCRAASSFHGAAARLEDSRLACALMRAVGIDLHRPLPTFPGETFTQWLDGRADEQKRFSRSVYFFPGCHVNYNCPELGRDLVKILNACGYGVRTVDGARCCGADLIASGFGARARSRARANVRALESVDGPVLTTSSTCTFTIREEYGNVLALDTASVRDSVQMAVRWLSMACEEGTVRLAFREDWHAKASYHTACHMNSLGWSVYSVGLLRMIPGMDLTVLEQECCGMAGSFGLKKENYDFSQKIGSKLFAAIEASSPEMVITDCESCKWQIESNVALPVMNTISVIADALDVKKTEELNNA